MECLGARERPLLLPLSAKPPLGLYLAQALFLQLQRPSRRNSEARPTSLLGLRAHPGQSCGGVGVRGMGRKASRAPFGREGACQAQPPQVLCCPVSLGLARVRQGQRLSTYCVQPREVHMRAGVGVGWGGGGWRGGGGWKGGGAKVLTGCLGHGPGAGWIRSGQGSVPGIWGTQGHSHKDDTAPLQESAIKQER